MKSNPVELVGAADQSHAGDTRNFFSSERKDAANLRDEMNKDLGEKLIKLFEQKRAFLNSLPTFTGIIVGLSSFAPNILQNNFYRLGLVFQIVTVILILLYSREQIDLDMLGIRKLRDRYSGVVEAKITLIDAYAEKGVFTEASFSNYSQDLQDLPEVVSLREENKKLNDARKKRSEETLDFFAELSIFLFSSSAIFILFGLLDVHPKWWQISLIFIPFAFICFSDFLAYLSVPFNISVTYLKKKGLLLDATSTSIK